ncbi:MAG: hypothetical protein N2Z70_07200 [Bdellovibrionaceae bacterium]|nr:hypothetical protein [Pseudobdellovibrionaceae bacterium]
MSIKSIVFSLLMSILIVPASFGGSLGAGISIGYPTGVTLKQIERGSVDGYQGTLGWGFSPHARSLLLQADRVWSWAELSPYQMKNWWSYYGLGGKLGTTDQYLWAGLRVPVGIQSFIPLPRHRVEFFAETALVLLLTPLTTFHLDLCIGGRWYF